VTLNALAASRIHRGATWRRLSATARLTFRAAACSKVLVSLAALLVLTIVVLPMLIKGDGTVHGQVRILLKYTLGFSAGILAIMTVWTSCGAVSREIAERQLQLVMVKPIRPVELWAGKWLGILLMNAVLLLLSGAAVYIQLQRILHEPGVTAEQQALLQREVLVARHSLPAHAEVTPQDAYRYVEKLRAAGRWPDNLRPAESLAVAERQLRMRRNAVAAGEERTWRFDIPSSIDPEAPAFLRFRCTASMFSAADIHGTWYAGPPDGPALFQAPMKAALGRQDHLQLPTSIMQPGQPLHVTFKNGSSDRSTTILFDHARQPQLLHNATSFEGNLFRALLLLLCFQGLLGALGLTAGSLFSSPVAMFTATGTIILFVLVHAFAPSGVLKEEMSGLDHGVEIPAFVETINQVVVKTFGIVVEPVMQFGALEPLSDGLYVSWSTTARAGLLLVIIYPGLLAVFSSFLLRRRELGNPEIS